MLKAPSGSNWAFDGFTLLIERRLLLGNGTPVPLTAKAFDTLVVLIANGDRVVTKNELLRSVWPDVEVEEGNLTQQISCSARHWEITRSSRATSSRFRVMDTGSRRP